MAEACCKDVIAVDVTSSLTSVTTRSAAAHPAGRSGGSPHWRGRRTGNSPHSGSRWASAIRIRGAGSVGGRQLSAFGEPVGVSYPHSGSRWASAIRIQGAGGRQLSAFGGPVGVSYPHSGSRWASAIRIRGAGGRQLSAFGGPVGVSYPHSGSRWVVSYPHSGSRWASAIRIQGAGGRQLSAFGGPVGVSYPHSGSRWASAIRIQGAGGRQLSAFGEPVGVSYPHSGSRWASAIRIRGPVGVSYPHWRGRRELPALTGLVEGTLRGRCRDGGRGCAVRGAPVLPVGGRRACRLKPAFQAGGATGLSQDGARVGMTPCRQPWFRAPARCRPEAGAPSRCATTAGSYTRFRGPSPAAVSGLAGDREWRVPGSVPRPSEPATPTSAR